MLALTRRQADEWLQDNRDQVSGDPVVVLLNGFHPGHIGGMSFDAVHETPGVTTHVNYPLVREHVDKCLAREKRN